MIEGVIVEFRDFGECCKKLLYARSIANGHSSVKDPHHAVNEVTVNVMLVAS